jgi:glycosyltransferase involved in cell wall biosynthesis
MKIAIFSDNFYPEISGISDSIIATAQELARMGHQVCFFVPNYSEKNYKTAGIASKREIDLGENIQICRFSSLPFPTATNQSRFVIPSFHCWLKVRKFKPDIIHTNLFFGVGLEALLAAKILGIPLVGTNHTAITEFVRYSPIKGKWAEKLSLKYVNWYYGKCTFLSAPSKSVFDEMMKFGFKKNHEVISNPIDTEAYGLGADYEKEKLKNKFGISDKTVVYAGRFAPEKDIDVIIRAMALVKEKIPSVTLAMAGHGASLGDIKKLAIDLGIEKNIKFQGTLNRFDLADLYRASEIFAITSTSETQSMTLIQAMACGVATIGVRARALPEYLKGNGIIVEPGDYKTLAEKIIYLLENPEDRKRMGECGFKFVEQFFDKSIALKWENIYKRESRQEKKMKLSFVIPAWNEEKYIGQCLESIIREVKKTSHDVEIIAVNNASVDKTREIILSYPEVKLVDEPKKGLPQARQAGFMASSGDLIANMDSDSILPPLWIEKVFQEFYQNENLVALSGPYIYYDLSGLANIGVKLFYVLGIISHFFAHYVFRKGAAIQGGNFVLKRTALEKIGGFDVSIKFYGEDTDIARRIQKVGKVKFTFGFLMYTSGRRLKKEGVLTMAIKYAINYLWVILFKKPFTQKYLYVGGEKVEKNK